MNTIDKIFEIDKKKTVEKITHFIRTYFNMAGVSKAIVGLSGGVDSSLTAMLTINALGKDKIIGLILPSNITPRRDIEDAKMMAEWLGINYHQIDITQIVEDFKKALNTSDKITIGNVMARTRMILLYGFANQYNGIVLGTGNKTELLVGYFTKYGDGGVDILPIGDLYKTDVWNLAKYLDVPERIVKKTPSAGLWPGQTDEGELGLSYSLLDKILAGLVELKLDKKQISELLNTDIKIIEKVEQLIKQSEHKRNPPPIAKVR
ncbi:MAG: NAD+ synthase [Candidatus Asgardarchaeia archaeon]